MTAFTDFPHPSKSNAKSDHMAELARRLDLAGRINASIDVTEVAFKLNANRVVPDPFLHNEDDGVFQQLRMTIEFTSALVQQSEQSKRMGWPQRPIRAIQFTLGHDDQLPAVRDVQLQIEATGLDPVLVEAHQFSKQRRQTQVLFFGLQLGSALLHGGAVLRPEGIPVGFLVGVTQWHTIVDFATFRTFLSMGKASNRTRVPNDQGTQALSDSSSHGTPSDTRLEELAQHLDEFATQQLCNWLVNVDLNDQHIAASALAERQKYERQRNLHERDFAALTRQNKILRQRIEDIEAKPRCEIAR